MARAKGYNCGSYVGGLPPTRPAVEDGPPRRPRSCSVVYSRGRLRAPKRDSHGSGACALRLASERRPGRADGVALTRARSSRRDDMADVDRRRTRPGSGQATTTPGVTSSPQHFRIERIAGEASSPCKTRKSTSSVFAASASCAQRSCGAVIELLVCATASHENYYGPCETPIQNDAAMPFLEQNKPPGC